MLTLLTALAAVSAVQPAPAATGVARRLESMPDVTVSYYDVRGRDLATLQKSMKTIISAPAPNSAARLFSWNAGVRISKRTEGTTCTITSAKATLKGQAYLPRATEVAQAPAAELGQWTAYVGSLESRAAENLAFVAARLPAIEQALVGKPCDAAAGLWSEGMQNLMREQAAFDKMKRDAEAAKAKAEAAKAAPEASRGRRRN